MWGLPLPGIINANGKYIGLQAQGYMISTARQ
jgi:hypothetical protein